MSQLFYSLLELCRGLGDVTGAVLHEDFLSVEGVAGDGRRFSVTVHLRE